MPVNLPAPFDTTGFLVLTAEQFIEALQEGQVTINGQTHHFLQAQGVAGKETVVLDRVIVSQPVVLGPEHHFFYLIQLKQVHFTGHLYFQGCRFEQRLAFMQVCMDQPVIFEKRCHFARQIVFGGGTFRHMLLVRDAELQDGLAFTGGHYQNLAELRNGRFHGPIVVNGGRFAHGLQLTGGLYKDRVGIAGGTFAQTTALSGGTYKAPVTIDDGTFDRLALFGGRFSAPFTINAGSFNRLDVYTEALHGFYLVGNDEGTPAVRHLHFHGPIGYEVFVKQAYIGHLVLANALRPQAFMWLHGLTLPRLTLQHAALMGRLLAQQIAPHQPLSPMAFEPVHYADDIALLDYPATFVRFENSQLGTAQFVNMAFELYSTCTAHNSLLRHVQLQHNYWPVQPRQGYAPAMIELYSQLQYAMEQLGNAHIAHRYEVEYEWWFGALQ